MITIKVELQAIVQNEQGEWVAAYLLIKNGFLHMGIREMKLPGKMSDEAAEAYIEDQEAAGMEVLI